MSAGDSMKHTVVVPGRLLAESLPDGDIVGWATLRTAGKVWVRDWHEDTYMTDDDAAAAVLTALARGGWPEVERLREVGGAPLPVPPIDVSVGSW